MPIRTLTPEQEAHARIITQKVDQLVRLKVLEMARLTASKADDQVLGATEFQLRDLAHQIAAALIQAEVQERQKKATGAPA